MLSARNFSFPFFCLIKNFVYFKIRSHQLQISVSLQLKYLAISWLNFFSTFFPITKSDRVQSAFDYTNDAENRNYKIFVILHSIIITPICSSTKAFFELEHHFLMYICSFSLTKNEITGLITSLLDLRGGLLLKY